MNNVKEIKLDQIVPSKMNSRKSFNDVKMEGLTASVKEKGVIQPIVVRIYRPILGEVNGTDLKRMPSKSNPEYEIVCGERRYRAASALSLETIPAIVRELTDEEAKDLNLIENLQREDMGAIEEAQGLQEACKEHPVAELASRIGKSLAYVTGRLKLLSLPDSIQAQISSEALSPGHGLIIARLQDPKDQQQLAQAIVAQKLSIRAAENALARHGREISAAPFNTDKCAKCKNNGTKQRDLLDTDTNLAGRCMDAACFDKKVAELGRPGKSAAEAKKPAAKGPDLTPIVEQIVSHVHKDTNRSYLRLLAQGLMDAASPASKYVFMKRRDHTMSRMSAEGAMQRYFKKIEDFFIPGFCVELVMLSQGETLIKAFQKHYGVSLKAVKVKPEPKAAADFKTMNPGPVSAGELKIEKPAKKTVADHQAEVDAALKQMGAQMGKDEKAAATETKKPTKNAQSVTPVTDRVNAAEESNAE